jgi:hypothetical protein
VTGADLTEIKVRNPITTGRITAKGTIQFQGTVIAEPSTKPNGPAEM